MMNRFKIFLQLLMAGLTLLAVICADAEVADLTNPGHPVAISSQHSGTSDTAHQDKYFLHISSPTEIKFYCEQRESIVFINSAGYEKYIPLSGPFEPHAVRDTVGDCGMEKSCASDLLGNYGYHSNKYICDENYRDQDGLTKAAWEKRCRNHRKEILELKTSGFKVNLQNFNKEGCREINEKIHASCVTDRRVIYVRELKNNLAYSSYDFKSPTWDFSTDIASSQATWEMGPGDLAAIHFENGGYQYRFEIQHLQSLATGAVSVFKDGKKLQTEICKLLYFSPGILPASKNP